MTLGVFAGAKRGTKGRCGVFGSPATVPFFPTRVEVVIQTLMLTLSIIFFFLTIVLPLFYDYLGESPRNWPYGPWDIPCSKSIIDRVNINVSTWSFTCIDPIGTAV